MQNKLAKARVKLLMKAPFYGNLVMRLRFGLAPCGTAFTDMKRIVFDADFLKKLSEKELLFVLQHEVLHCVLQHCIRSRDYDRRIYNIAADIVVNSTILQSMEPDELDEFRVLGDIMHLAPNGEEGRLYSAEEIYYMIKDMCNDEFAQTMDNHSIWDYIPDSEGSYLAEEWKEYIKEAVGKSGEQYGLPPVVRNFLKEFECESKTDWRAVLREFVQITKSDPDYTFSPPDKRFSGWDFFLPAYEEMEQEKIDKIWFLIDTSGSITDKELAEVYAEIQECINQFSNVSGKLSFFDTMVYDVMEFDTGLESIEWESIVPVGGGGTSFQCIFRHMKEHMEQDLPTAIIVLTDGFARYPQEEEAMGVPVLWMITGDLNQADAPWGKTVHL